MSLPLFLLLASGTAGEQRYIIELDTANDGTFAGENDDITGDVVSVETYRGRDGTMFVGRADPGKASIVVLNTTAKYSSWNTSSVLYQKLFPGRLVRVRSAGAIAAKLWTGYLSRVVPSVAEVGALPTATIEAVGALQLLAAQPHRSEASTGDLVSNLIIQVLDDIGWPSDRRDIQTSAITTGQWEPGTGSALDALQSLAEVGRGFLYEDKDGRVVYEDRHYRVNGFGTNGGTVQATFSDDPSNSLRYRRIEQEERLDEIYNEVLTRYRAGLTVGAEAELWDLNPIDPDTLPAGETVAYVATYPGPGDTTGLYVNAWTTPTLSGSEASADIMYTTASSALTVAVRKTANKMFIYLTNPGASTATLTKVSARGTPVTWVDSVELISKNVNSQATYGRRVLDRKANLYADQDAASEAADDFLAWLRDLRTHVYIQVPGHKDAGHLGQCLTREISDLVLIEADGAAQLGSALAYWVESISHRIDEGGTRHLTTFHLLGRTAAGWGGVSSSDARTGSASSAGDDEP